MKHSGSTHSRSTHPRRGGPLLGAALVALCLAHGPAAHAAVNLVQDGDFETADPGARDGSTDYFGDPGDPPTFDSSWTVTAGAVGIDTGRNYVYDGNKSLWLNADPPSQSATNSILQTVATAPGQTYLLTFAADTGGTQPLTVTFGGAVVGGGPLTVPANGFPNPGGAGANAAEFTLYSFNVTTSTALTDLTFAAPGNDFGGPEGTLELDDINLTPASLSAAPEPPQIAALGAFGLGLGALAVRARRKTAAA